MINYILVPYKNTRYNYTQRRGRRKTVGEEKMRDFYQQIVNVIISWH
jgi:hypothetical protein